MHILHSDSLWKATRRHYARYHSKWFSSALLGLERHKSYKLVLLCSENVWYIVWNFQHLIIQSFKIQIARAHSHILSLLLLPTSNDAALQKNLAIFQTWILHNARTHIKALSISKLLGLRYGDTRTYCLGCSTTGLYMKNWKNIIKKMNNYPFSSSNFLWCVKVM